jgi:hypothetical protein
MAVTIEPQGERNALPMGWLVKRNRADSLGMGSSGRKFVSHKKRLVS